MWTLHQLGRSISVFVDKLGEAGDLLSQMPISHAEGHGPLTLKSQSF